MANENPFTDLYSYFTESGIVMPDTADVKEMVETRMKEIFNDQNLDTTEETPVGRLIEAISLLIVDTMNVNAQNANQYNLNYATGQYLDALATLFQKLRKPDETDAKFRNRIKGGRNSDIAYNESLYSAINAIEGVVSACVIDNGSFSQKFINGVYVSGHSVFISIKSDGSDETYQKIANAIYRNKSAGCGYTRSGTTGTLKTVTVTDENSGIDYNVYFFEPAEVSLNITVNVDTSAYTGYNIGAEVKDAVKTYVGSIGIGKIVSPTAMAVFITQKIPTVVVNGITMNGSDSQIDLTALQIASVSDSNIEVVVQ